MNKYILINDIIILIANNLNIIDVFHYHLINKRHTNLLKKHILIKKETIKRIKFNHKKYHKEEKNDMLILYRSDKYISKICIYDLLYSNKIFGIRNIRNSIRDRIKYIKKINNNKINNLILYLNYKDFDEYYYNKRYLFIL